MAFTLHRETSESTSLEFALRIKKKGKTKVRLCLICGLTGEEGKPDCAAPPAVLRGGLAALCGMSVGYF